MKKAWTYIVLFWFFLYSWRPFVLGFYHDDWSSLVDPANFGAAFSYDRLRHFMIPSLNRPVSGFIYYVFSSLFGKSAFFWHVAIIFIVLLTAFALRKFLSRLLVFLRIKDSWLSNVGAVLWLVLPWGVGISSWPIAGMLLLSLLFFLVANTLVFGCKSVKDIFIINGLLTLSFLTYEAFYFQPLLIMGLVFLVAMLRSKAFPIKQFWLLTSAVFTQLAVILYSRLVSAYVGGVIAKSIYGNWPDLFSSSRKRLYDILLTSLTEVKLPVRLLLWLFVIVTVFSIDILMRKNLKEFWSLKKDVILAFIVSVLGVVASVFLYSLTGYGIDSIGLFARTTIAISFWLIIGLVLLTSLSLNQTFAKKIIQICLYGIIGFFMFASTNRTLEWAQVWETQKKVLASAPIEQIKKVGEKDLVVFVGPYIYKGIHIFAAIWDITSAVNNSYSELLERKYRTSFTVQRDWESVWDGEKLVQINSITNQKVWVIPAEKVWVWDYPRGQFYELEAPAKIAPQNSGD